MGSISHIYFLFLVIVGQFIILQSFTAIVLGIFQQNRKKVMTKKTQTLELIRKFFNSSKTKIKDSQANKKEDVVYNSFLSSKIKSRLQSVVRSVRKQNETKPTFNNEKFQNDYHLNILNVSQHSEED